MLRPTTEYGKFTEKDGKTTFAPNVIPPNQYSVPLPADQTVTPQQFAQAAG